MYRMAKNIAGKAVVTREAKTKSLVNAIICHVPLRFGNSRHAVPLTWPVKNDRLRRRP
jgi:hypothetical protein